MKYLSFDIEATGLDQDCKIIEFACVPFDASNLSPESSIAKDLTFHHYIKCPSFDELKASLNPWVRENMQDQIQLSHQKGTELSVFKTEFEQYLSSDAFKEYFQDQKVVLFGKSMNAIDLPFLNRDLGWDWMRDKFHFRVLDLSAFSFGLMDLNLLPEGMDSGSKLMEYFGMGEVAHTALEDAINVATLYLKLLAKFQK